MKISHYLLFSLCLFCSFLVLPSVGEQTFLLTHQDQYLAQATFVKEVVDGQYQGLTFKNINGKTLYHSLEMKDLWLLDHDITNNYKGIPLKTINGKMISDCLFFGKALSIDQLQSKDANKIFIYNTRPGIILCNNDLLYSTDEVYYEDATSKDNKKVWGLIEDGPAIVGPAIEVSSYYRKTNGTGAYYLQVKDKQGTLEAIPTNNVTISIDFGELGREGEKIIVHGENYSKFKLLAKFPPEKSDEMKKNRYLVRNTKTKRKEVIALSDKELEDGLKELKITTRIKNMLNFFGFGKKNEELKPAINNLKCPSDAKD